MGKTRYTILGWVVWQIGSRVVKRKLAQPRVKVGAAAVVALALAAGLAAARAGAKRLTFAGAIRCSREPGPTGTPIRLVP